MSLGSTNFLRSMQGPKRFVLELGRSRWRACFVDVDVFVPGLLIVDGKRFFVTLSYPARGRRVFSGIQESLSGGVFHL